jgi:hypothetical protein
MKHLVAGLCLFVFAAPAWAGLSSAVIVLPTEAGRRAPAVSIVQPADYLCAVVTLRSTAKDAERQSGGMRESLQRVRSAVEKSPRFQLHEGPVRFGEGGGSFYSSKASGGTLQTSLRILAPLQNGADVFETMKQLRQFVGAFSALPDTELSVASISLAVIAPEQFRERLLSLIADQTQTIQRSLNARVVTIDGLQNPVLVRQVDDANVELYIDYQMSATMEMRP